MTGILFVLRSGIPWEMLPKELGCGSGMTCWRRLREIQEGGDDPARAAGVSHSVADRRAPNEAREWLGAVAVGRGAHVCLGSYEIVAPLGAGGMGEVYKARDTRIDRTVAVKVLPTQLAMDPALRERVPDGPRRKHSSPPARGCSICLFRTATMEIPG